ncbi:MAG: type II secretion system secretin GspD [Gammaproteobacteria bacterium]|nr:type II secretion system secretin GspD [Gammaproteobacteria bacterium]
MIARYPGHTGWLANCRHALRILAALLLFATASAQAGMPSGATITLNFVDTDIREVATSVSEITGKTFILDPRVKGRVTLVSAQPIAIEAVYDTFLSVLQVHNFAAVEGGNGTIKIVPSVEAKQIGGGVGSPESLPFDDMVTQVVALRNAPAAQLVPILRPLIPQYGHMSAYPGGNFIIISDRAGNVDRVLNVIRKIDRASDNDVDVITLENASASETVRVLSALMQNAGRDTGGTPPTIAADDRTNSVLISGSQADRLRMRALISHLDTPLESGGNTQVVYLRYANSENLANILKGQVTEVASKEEESQGGSRGGYSDVVVLHEPDTNALVITAPPKIMRNLQTIIEKLDIRRAQVHVEAIIAEISSNNSAELGVTWAADGADDDSPVGITNFPGSGVGVGQVAGALEADDGAGQATAGLLNQAAGLTLGFGRIVSGETSFVGLLRALAGNSSTNILSTPSITTMDNEEAEIKVGQEVPFLSGSYANTGQNNSVNPFQTINREEVGISLKVTPQISDSTTIVLKIEQEVSSLQQGSQGAVDLITNNRSITTSVVAENNEIIVLGGLIDDQVQEGEQRVPLLGSIPVLGELFRYRTSSKIKRNLMVFLKPSILRTPEDSALYTNEKYRQIRDLQRGRKEDGSVSLMPSVSQPIAPEYDERGLRIEASDDDDASNED